VCFHSNTRELPTTNAPESIITLIIGAQPRQTEMEITKKENGITAIRIARAKPDDHVNLTKPTNPDDYCEDHWTIKFSIIPCQFDQT